MIWALVAQNAVKSVAQNVAKNQSTSTHSEKSLTLHWTDDGVCSWYDFAVAIQELAIEKGMLDKAIPVRPIPASAYPTPAKRPSFSVIDKSTAEQASGIETTHWRQQLSAMLDELKHNLDNS